MKTKFLLTFLLLSQILAFSGCARQKSPDIAEGSSPAAVSVAEPGGAIIYHSYVINETGEITEEPSPEMTEDSKQEVIPSPSCAKLLDGKVLLQETKDEKDNRFFLRDVDTGEEQFLFDAWEVLAITKDGIYYFADMGTTLMYYSFAEAAGKELTLSGPLTAAEISTGFYDVTWSPDALYLYGRFPDTLQILEVDPDRLSVEAIAEWDESEEGSSSMINQVDNEYFYHGDQAFPLIK